MTLGRGREEMADLAIILNKASGSAGEDPGFAIEAGLKRLGLCYVLRVAPPDAFTAAVEAARDEGFRTIVVAGGDGSIRTAAGVLAGSSASLGIIPLGTANLLARDLKIPVEIDAALDCLAQGHVREVDLGRVNGHVFLIHTVLGRLNAPAQLRERRRGVRGLATWLYITWSVVQALWRYPKRRYVMEADGAGSRFYASFVAVAVNRVTGQIGNPFHRIALDAGRLAVYAFPAPAKGSVGTETGPLSLPVGLADVFHVLDARGVVIKTRRRLLHAALDGEVHHLRSPLRLQVEPAALKIIVPPAGSSA